MKASLSRIFAFAALCALPGLPLTAQDDTASGDDSPPPVIKGPPSVRVALWATTPRGPERLAGIFIFKYENGVLQYADNPEGYNPKTLSFEIVNHIAVDLPEDIKDALDMYQQGRFPAAATRLENAIKRYKLLRNLEFLPIRRMEIMWLDSLRRTGDFDKLREQLDLVKIEEHPEGDQAMIQALAGWEAHARRGWPRLETLTRNLDSIPPGTAAAELAFLRGEALRRLSTNDNSDREAMLSDALAEYHRAMAMDFTFSRDLMGDAALAALEIYNEDHRVEEYFRRFGTPDYSEEAGYNIPVREAAWLAYLLDSLQPGGRKLPNNSTRLLEVYQRMLGDIRKETIEALRNEAPAPSLDDTQVEEDADE